VFLAPLAEVDFNSKPWVADAQDNRWDTKFRNLGIRLGYQILTFGLMKCTKVYKFYADN
jgi:hypothetical protein